MLRHTYNNEHSAGKLNVVDGQSRRPDLRIGIG